MEQNKIYTDIDTLTAQIQRQKKFVEKFRPEKKFTVGITFGVFDLPHAGHIRFLEEARKQCDFLIVSASSDERARQFKGPDRPYNKLGDRQIVLSGLASVDAVMSHNTSQEIQTRIDTIHPDLVFAGADYAQNPEYMAGGASLNGAERVVIEDPPRREWRSTTGIAKSIREVP